MGKKTKHGQKVNSKKECIKSKSLNYLGRKINEDNYVSILYIDQLMRKKIVC